MRPVPDVTPHDPLARIQWLAERTAKDARSPEVQAFARAVLERVSGPRCDAVDMRTRGGRQRVALEALQLVRETVRFERDQPPDGSGDDFKDPQALLVRQAGDCDDSGPLLAAVLTALGFRVALVGMSVHTGYPEHLSVEVLIDGEWFYADPTLESDLGEDPYDAASRLQSKRADLGR